MRNESRYLQSEDIEINCDSLCSRKLNISKLLSLRESLHDIWEKLVKTLMADPNELQVWQKVDRYGNISWHAYDPVTRKSFSSGSEFDVCMWIEQLYRF
ncbi:hypothetical protein WKK05_20935 [Nostoc sp. UHCC 0302]|uniref:hypothetical protein n=1 Tax=Nostoc sp. UHCC 0302 TaxID=3134896 RepID=UPI00311CB1C6